MPIAGPWLGSVPGRVNMPVGLHTVHMGAMIFLDLDLDPFTSLGIQYTGIDATDWGMRTTLNTSVVVE